MSLLGAISISENGVKEGFFTQILSDYTWATLVVNLNSFITTINGRVKFRDEIFKDFVKQKYVTTKEAEEYYRKELINYYSKDKQSNIDDLLFQYEKLLEMYKRTCHIIHN